jgi:hypothetical protein
MVVTMPETVYVLASGSVTKSVYHTDRDCRALADAANVRERSCSSVDASRWRKCRYCSGDYSPSGAMDRSHFNALLAAENDDE